MEIPFSGRRIAVTFSAESASTVSFRQSAESIPPLTPITAFSNPFCLKYLWRDAMIFV